MFLVVAAFFAVSTVAKGRRATGVAAIEIYPQPYVTFVGVDAIVIGGRRCIVTYL